MLQENQSTREGALNMLKIEDLLAQNERLAREILAPGADEVDRGRRFPRENLEALGRAGLLGLLVPPGYGGAGGGIPEMSSALDQMAQGCPSTAMVALMHYCGTAVLVAKGSAKLKRDVLPAIALGEHMTTLAFSEAGSGGHFYSPVSQVSKNGHGITLSADKTFVTSAGEAEHHALTHSPERGAGRGYL